MYKDILFPIDITDKDQATQKARQMVLDFHKAFDANIHVMTVVSDYGMSIVQQYFPSGSVDKVVHESNKALHDYVSRHFPEKVEVQHIVGKGAVYESIIQTADKINADLIVMAAHRPELKDYLLGPNAAKVVRHCGRSVLVVRD